MVSRPLVSIIIPTYNGGRYLVETIQSALAQDYPHTEIIVVDDGSPTDIQSLLCEFGGRVKLLTQKNSGPGAARNYGANESRGELLAFLDHDDLWAPEKITRQVAEFIRNPHCALAYCYPQLIDSQGNEIPNTSPSHFPSGSVFEDFIKRNRITTYSATMIRRSAFFDAGGIDDSLNILTCDDYDLWLKLAAKHDVVFTPGALTYYRIHPGNLVNNHHTNMQAHLQVMENCREFLRLNEGVLELAFNYEKAMAENEIRCYRKFGFIFYNDFPKSNIDARKALIQAVDLSLPGLKSFVYFLFTFQLFVMARQVKRSFGETKPVLDVVDYSVEQSNVFIENEPDDEEATISEAV